VGQKPSPAVGVVAGPERDACQAGDDRRLDRILEQDGAVKTPAPQFSGQTELPSDAGMASRFFEDDDLVHIGAKAVHLGDPGFG